MRTVIVIPAHDEAGAIAQVVAGAAAHGTPLVVDDGSSDETAERAAEAGAEVLRLEENRGYEGALEVGFRRAAEMGAEAVATLDADGQLDPDLLDGLLAPLRAGRADLAIAIRPHAARIAEAIFGLYTRLRFDVPDALCGAKAYRIGLYRRHGRFDGGRSVGTELALASIRRGARAAKVPVAVRPRGAGASRFGATPGANRRILRALLDTVRADLSGAWRA